MVAITGIKTIRAQELSRSLLLELKRVKWIMQLCTLLIFFSFRFLWYYSVGLLIPVCNALNYILHLLIMNTRKCCVTKRNVRMFMIAYWSLTFHLKTSIIILLYFFISWENIKFDLLFLKWFLKGNQRLSLTFVFIDERFAARPSGTILRRLFRANVLLLFNGILPERILAGTINWTENLPLAHLNEIDLNSELFAGYFRKRSDQVGSNIQIFADTGHHSGDDLFAWFRNQKPWKPQVV